MAKIVFATVSTGLSPLEKPLVAKVVKTGKYSNDQNFAGFSVSNCFILAKVHLDAIGTCPASCLISFLVSDC